MSHQFGDALRTALGINFQDESGAIAPGRLGQFEDSDNVEDNSSTGFELNWGCGILFALLAVWAMVLGGIARDYSLPQDLFHQLRQGVPAYEVPPQPPLY